MEFSRCVKKLSDFIAQVSTEFSKQFEIIMKRNKKNNKNLNMFSK